MNMWAVVMVEQPRTFDHEIQLIGLVEGTDESGFPKEEIKPKPPILANRLSIRSSEYWQAKQAGVELSYTFEVHSFEYAGEEKMLYEGNEYTIERTYEKGDIVELICKRRADDHAYSDNLKEFITQTGLEDDGHAF